MSIIEAYAKLRTALDYTVVAVSKARSGDKYALLELRDGIAELYDTMTADEVIDYIRESLDKDTVEIVKGVKEIIKRRWGLE